PPRSPPFPYTTLFRSGVRAVIVAVSVSPGAPRRIVRGVPRVISRRVISGRLVTAARRLIAAGRPRAVSARRVTRRSVAGGPVATGFEGVVAARLACPRVGVTFGVRGVSVRWRDGARNRGAADRRPAGGARRSVVDAPGVLIGPTAAASRRIVVVRIHVVHTLPFGTAPGVAPPCCGEV